MVDIDVSSDVKRVEIGFLLDLYGNILTEKQKLSMDLYFQQDFSLSEIAEQLGITRQAVRDIIKKGERKLFEYEEKLLFMKKTINQEQKIQQILFNLTKIETNSSDKQITSILEGIKKELNCLV